MSINLHNLNEQEYNNCRLALIESVEGRESQIYIDSVGIATVGLGFNLRNANIVKIILKELIPNPYPADINTLVGAARNVSSSTQNARESITKAFNKILEGKSLPSVTEFTLADDEMDSIANEIANDKESLVSNHFSHSGFSAESYSYERLALFSLFYNGVVGPLLTDAINTGNRFKAWYEIRHNSNGGASESGGIAKRRYYESNLFGLFNDNNNPTQIAIRMI